MNQYEFHAYANLYPLATDDQLENLSLDIKTNGQTFPITLFNGKILDGRNRYRACLAAKVDPEFVQFEGTDLEAFEFARAANIQRRDLTASQRAAIAVFYAGPVYDELMGGLKKEAEKRRLEGNAKGGKGIKSVETFPQTSGEKSRDQYGKRWNVNGRYISDLETIREDIAKLEELAKRPEAEWADLINTHAGLRKLPDTVFNGLNSVAQAKIETAKLAYDIRVVEAEIERNAVPQLVLADPPWKYDFAETDSRAIENQYETATVNEIIGHKPLTAPDCILFMWATAPKLREALAVVEGWGFEYKSCAIWDKLSIGSGYWFRGQHELLLVATKGKMSPPIPSLRRSSVFSEASTEHSRKPRCVYEWIEGAFGDLRKTEAYSRSPRKGWAVWGNEV